MRHSIKITGSQGQGVNSVGEMCARGLKRTGYCVFGYREYMSLIKGGHSSYKLDISTRAIESSETPCDILVCFNHHGMQLNYQEVKPGGIIVHQTPMWKFPPEHEAWLKEHRITVVYLPCEDLLKKLKARPLQANVLIAAVTWSLLGQDRTMLYALVKEQFGHKGEAVVQSNCACIDEGYAYIQEHVSGAKVTLPKAQSKWQDHLLVTGSHAMGLGAVHAGVRMYVGYPMTPSSPLLTYISEIQNHTGMVIKQAEDEITAAQMVSGAMFMGTRALTATSGGGFDLMSETVSMNGIIENPAVFVLAQRPGPATGLPTWTAQGDALMAVGTAHGEFPRCVISVSDSQDAFDLMPVAFNIAEQYQTQVIVLTDKQIAEAIYTQAPYNQKKAKLHRGIVSDPRALAALKSSDRYDPHAPDGISPRWLPGSMAATYCAQGDEHDAEGAVDESAQNAILQMEKRMRKGEALQAALPEPVLYIDGKIVEPKKIPALDLLIVGWGSTKGSVLDAVSLLVTTHKGANIGYLHYTYLWPMKTDVLVALAKRAKKTVLMETNFTGQLGLLIAMTGMFNFEHKVLKYDGRPFFTDEVVTHITKHLPKKPAAAKAKSGRLKTAVKLKKKLLPNKRKR